MPAASPLRTSPKKPKKNVSLKTIGLTLPLKPPKDTTTYLSDTVSPNVKIESSTASNVLAKPPKGDNTIPQAHQIVTLHDLLRQRDEERLDQEANIVLLKAEIDNQAHQIVTLHAFLRQRDKERLDQEANILLLKAEIDNLSASCRKLRLDASAKDYKFAEFDQERLEWREESTKRYKELKEEIFALQEACRKHKIELLTKDSEIAAWRSERSAIETELDSYRKKVERESLQYILHQKNISLNFGREREALDEKVSHMNAEIETLQEENIKIANDALQWKTRFLAQKKQYTVARGVIYGVNLGFTESYKEEDAIEIEEGAGEKKSDQALCEESKRGNDINVSHTFLKSPQSTRRTCQEEIQKYLEMISPSKWKMREVYSTEGINKFLQ